MNYVEDCVTFLFNCVIGSVFSPEEGSNFFRNAVYFLGIFLENGNILVNDADIIQVPDALIPHPSLGTIYR